MQKKKQVCTHNYLLTKAVMSSLDEKMASMSVEEQGGDKQEVKIH